MPFVGCFDYRLLPHLALSPISTSFVFKELLPYILYAVFAMPAPYAVCGVVSPQKQSLSREAKNAHMYIGNP